jgi:metal-responsive CopG/Arc/MetJ family transcriptional regulator
MDKASLTTETATTSIRAVVPITLMRRVDEVAKKHLTSRADVVRLALINLLDGDENPSQTTR